MDSRRQQSAGRLYDGTADAEAAALLGHPRLSPQPPAKNHNTTPTPSSMASMFPRSAWLHRVTFSPTHLQPPRSSPHSSALPPAHFQQQPLPPTATSVLPSPLSNPFPLPVVITTVPRRLYLSSSANRHHNPVRHSSTEIYTSIPATISPREHLSTSPARAGPHGRSNGLGNFSTTSPRPRPVSSATASFLSMRHRTVVFINLVSIMERMDEQIVPALSRPLGCAFRAGPHQLGLITFARALVQAVASPLGGLAGHFFDRVTVLFVGCAIWGFFCVTFSFASTVEQGIAAWAFNGVGLSLIIPNSQSLIADYYTATQRGEAFGALMLTGAFGGMLGALFATNLGGLTPLGIPGWRLAFMTVGAVSLVIGAFTLVLAVDPTRHHRTTATRRLMYEPVCSPPNIPPPPPADCTKDIATFPYSGDSNDFGTAEIEEHPYLRSPREDPRVARLLHHSEESLPDPGSDSHWEEQPLLRKPSTDASASASVPSGSPPGTVDSPSKAPALDSAYEETVPQRPLLRCHPPSAAVTKSHATQRQFGQGDVATDGGPTRTSCSNPLDLGKAGWGEVRVAGCAVEGGSYESASAAAPAVVGTFPHEHTELTWRRIWTMITTPTFLIIILQGIVGSTPWNALVFLTLYLQLIGFSDATASCLMAILLGGTAAGALVGGWLGDRVAERYPHHGRVALVQFSVGIGVPLSYLIMRGLPLEANPGTAVAYATLMLLKGLLTSWAAPACNNPVFAEIVPPDMRNLVYAFDRSFEGAISALGAPLVGMAAERWFGFTGTTGGEGGCESSNIKKGFEPDLPRARSLGDAMLLFMVVPWTLCALFYTGLHWTYPRDRALALKPQMVVVAEGPPGHGRGDGGPEDLQHETLYGRGGGGRTGKSHI